MPGHTIANEDGPVPGTADKRGSGEPTGFEFESPAAQAALLQMFPYLIDKYPERARELGYGKD